MSGIKDLNDAVMSGFSLDQIIRTAEGTSVTVDQDKEINREDSSIRGLENLRLIVDNIEKEPDHKNFAKHLLLDETQFNELGWAWLYNEHQMQPLIFQLQNTLGIMTKATNFLKIIKRRAKNLQKEIEAQRKVDVIQHKSRRGVPNKRVMDLLDYDWIKIDGQYARGEIKSSKLNMETILKEDPRMAKKFRYSKFDGRTHFLNKKNELQMIDDILESRIGSWVSQVYGLELADSQIGKIISLIASDNEFHPVQTYLKQLSWDGVQRLSRFLPDYLNSPDHADVNLIGTKDKHPDYSVYGIEGRATIVQLYGIRWMMAAVMRAMKPGIKCDTLLCLIGEQGIGKSTAVKELCYDHDWFSDTPFDLTKKDSYIQIQGKWLVELPECETLHRSGYNAAKSFLSSCRDRYRQPYRRHAVDVERTSILVATTNQNRLGFLNDASGHRRYWVCRVGKCDYQKIREDRDQLWAEAYHYCFNQIENPKVNRQHYLNPHEEKARQNLNDHYREIDSWEEEICGWLVTFYVKCLTDNRKYNQKKGPPFTLKNVLREALHIQEKDQRKHEIDRVGIVLGRIGAERYGRKKVGRAFARLWYISPSVFKALVKSYRTWTVPSGEEEEAVDLDSGELIGKIVLDYMNRSDTVQ